MHRRDFLKLASALPLLLIAPSVAAEPGAVGGRVLVLVQLAGGNDGLNMLVPYADPVYRRARPTLGLDRDQVLHLDEHVGLHPAFEPLMAAWKDKRLAVVQGVGYDDPNRSHFRSIEIWETASDSQEVLSSGWLNQVLATNGEPPTAIVLGNEEVGAVEGPDLRTLVMSEPARFIEAARRMPAGARSTPNAALAHILHVQQDIRQSADQMAKKLEHARSLDVTFPNHPLGRQLEIAAGLLVAGVTVSVVKVIHAGYDTHANQRGRHDRLMEELAGALAAFRSAMIRHGLDERVTLMTFAEFGRRIAENGSAGTDHGTAAPHLVLGGKVRGGLYGKHPSLSTTSSGDLIHTVDFRSMYATIAERWWGRATTFSGERFAPLDFLRG